MFIKSIVGIDISDHSIEALVVRKAFFSKPKITAYGRTILRGEIVRNGVIKKPDKLAAAILDVLRNAKPTPITTPYCIISLPDSQVFSAIIRLPAGLRHREIKNTIPYKAEELIPFKSSEIYFDFKTISRVGGTQEIFYVAAPIKIVDSYVDLLKKINLTPLALDMESVSLMRGLFDQQKLRPEPILMMDVGSRTTDISVVDRNGIRESFVIKIAGARFSKAIATALGISEKEASDIKIKNGFDPKRQDPKALSALQNECKKIIENIKRILDYYKKKNKRPIGGIVLAGGSALMPQFDQYLKNILGLEVIVGNPFDQVQSELANLKGKGVLYANVMGLALRGIAKRPIDGDINLLPMSVKKFGLLPPRHQKGSWMKIYIRLIVLAVLIVGLICLVWYRQSGHDPYEQIFSSDQYQQSTASAINQEVIDQLRFGWAHPATTTPTSTATTTPALFQVKIKPLSIGYLNVRAEPAATAKIVGKAISNQVYDVWLTQGDWFQIKPNASSTGWVNTGYVDKLK